VEKIKQEQSIGKFIMKISTIYFFTKKRKKEKEDYITRHCTCKRWHINSHIIKRKRYRKYMYDAIHLLLF